MAVTAADVEHAIRGIHFPSDRDGLIKQAESNKADSDVIDIIKTLPGNEFRSPIDVSKAFGEKKRSE